MPGRTARGDLPALGRLIADDDGARVQCHECGRFYAKLGMHVSRSHGMTPAEYRAEFGLNVSTGLASPALRRRLAERNGEHLARYRHLGDARLAALNRDGPAAWKRAPRRLQARLEQSETMQRAYADRPRKLKPERLAPAEVRERGRARIAELLADPEWRAARRATIAAARRTLTDEQAREIVALKGRVTQRELAKCFGVSNKTVGRVWQGGRAGG